MIVRAFVSVSWLIGACGSGNGTAPLPGDPKLLLVASGLSTPLLVTTPAGDPRVFIVEKAGRIRIAKNGTLLPAPFLDISARIASGGEQGLLGITFHPNYASNGLFVVDYTDQSGATRVSTFRVSSSDPDRADPSSEQVGLTVSQPFGNHNGGNVVFGPSGFLFIGLGDGGSGGDPQGNAQNLGTLLGSILRVQVTPAGAFTTPADNPFVGQAGARGEIWAYGLRNPWRFSFDGPTGDLYIADVGQNAREEIDVAPGTTGSGRGLNFGWNRMEGTRCYNPSSGCDTGGLTMPVLDYGHSEGCSVTGGFVYRGTALPALVGHYFYGEYCGGWVRSFRYSGGTVQDTREWSSLAPPGGGITSFGEDSAGELYITTAGGGVYRIVPDTP